MPISYVQGKQTYLASGTQIQVNLDSSVTAGNALVALIFWKADYNISDLSDDQSNSYSDCGLGRQTGSGSRYGAIMGCKNATSGSTTVTVTFDGTVNNANLYILEYSGQDTTTLFDGYGGASYVSGGSMSTGNITPSTSSGVVVALASGNPTNPDAPIRFNDGGDDYTIRVAYVTYQQASGDHIFTSSLGTFQVTAYIDVSSSGGVLIAAVIRAAGTVFERQPADNIGLTDYALSQKTSAGNLPIHIQGTHNGNNNTAQTSINVSLNGVVAGDLIVIAVGWAYEDASASCADDLSNPLEANTLSRYSPTAGANCQFFWYVCPTSGDRTFTVTFTSAGGVDYPRIIAVEFRAQTAGIWTAGQENQGSGSGTSVDAGALDYPSAYGIVLATASIDTGSTTSNEQINGQAATENAEESPDQSNQSLWYLIRDTSFSAGHATATIASHIWAANSLVLYLYTATTGVNISDAVARRIVSIVTRKIGDSAGMTDSDSRDMGYARFPSDDLGISDDAERILDFVRQVSDSVDEADSAQRFVAFIRQAAESVAVSDYNKSLKALLRSIADDLGMSDSVQRSMGLSRQVADSLDESDDAERVTQYVRGAADDVGLADYEERVLSYVRAIAEDVGLPDSAISKVAGIVARYVADTLGSTDSSQRVASFRRFISDDSGITDAASRIASFKRLASENVGLSDSATRIVAKARSIADGIGMDDYSLASKILARQIADSVGLSDDFQRVVLIVRQVADALGVTDDTRKSANIVRTISDLLDISDAVLRDLILPPPGVGIRDSIIYQTISAGITRKIAESIGIADDAERVMDFLRVVADQEDSIDSIFRKADFVRISADSVSTTDYGLRSLATARSIADNLGISDSVTSRQMLLVARMIYDNVGVPDEVERSFNAKRFLGDDIGVSDFYASYKAMVRAIADVSALNDVGKKSSEFARILFDSIDVTDAAARLLITGVLIRVISEDVGISDDVSSGLAKIRTIADSIGITDLPDIFRSLVRSISENYNLSDSPQIVKNMIRVIGELEGTSDSASRTQGFFRVLSDNVGVPDAVTYSLLQLLRRAISESVGVSDTASRVLTYARALADSVGASDFDAIYKQIVRSIGEDVGTTYDANRLVGYVRPLAEELGVPDAISYINTAFLTRYCYVADSVGLIDSITARTFIISWMAISIAVSKYIAISVADPFVQIGIAAPYLTLDVSEVKDSIDIDVATPYIILEVWK